ncbi:PREDICTED: uncharacterized protein LOC106818195 [Priapulus caudatus]|uniref:Uncharacterized protein LOC106818195 n=1 Tax=Priapulus caudatus TaxID=37621 RepID=A0ABM1F1T6_PRICU|nr:PREDICTED: uncharacterized protein LOC106818195 [Priapulus caudatus]
MAAATHVIPFLNLICVCVQNSQQGHQSGESGPKLWSSVVGHVEGEQGPDEGNWREGGGRGVTTQQQQSLVQSHSGVGLNPNRNGPQTPADSQKMDGEAFSRPAIVRDEDLKELDHIMENDQNGFSWAAVQSEVDYSKELKFSDDEDIASNRLNRDESRKDTSDSTRSAESRSHDKEHQRDDREYRQRWQQQGLPFDHRGGPPMPPYPGGPSGPPRLGPMAPGPYPSQPGRALPPKQPDVDDGEMWRQKRRLQSSEMTAAVERARQRREEEEKRFEEERKAALGEKLGSKRENKRSKDSKDINRSHKKKPKDENLVILSLTSREHRVLKQRLLEPYLSGTSTREFEYKWITTCGLLSDRSQDHVLGDQEKVCARALCFVLQRMLDFLGDVPFLDRDLIERLDPIINSEREKCPVSLQRLMGKYHWYMFEEIGQQTRLLFPELNHIQAVTAVMVTAVSLCSYILESRVNPNVISEYMKADEERTQDSRGFKDLGNQAFLKKDYSKALHCYTVAIEKNPFNHIVYEIRAQVYIKMKKYSSARSDCFRAMLLDETWLKAYYRDADALEKMGRLEYACATLHAAIKNCSLVYPMAEFKNINQKLAKVQQALLDKEGNEVQTKLQQEQKVPPKEQEQQQQQQQKQQQPQQKQ